MAEKSTRASDFEKEYEDHRARYAYMDDEEHKKTVLDFWKEWSSAREAVNQMIRSCFDETGNIDEEKLAWIVGTKMRPTGSIKSCFTAPVYRPGDAEPRLRVDESRLSQIIAAMVLP